jgi:hypothetical protein
MAFDGNHQKSPDRPGARLMMSETVVLVASGQDKIGRVAPSEGPVLTI